MRKKIAWEWEVLDEFTSRAKVIGGWLVCHYTHDGKKVCSESMQFVTDRDHEWSIAKPIVEVESAPKVSVSEGY